MANMNSLPLANKWFASAHIASGNSLPLVNIAFASEVTLTTGEPFVCSPAVYPEITTGEPGSSSPVIYVSAFKIKAEMYYNNIYTGKYMSIDRNNIID